MQAIVSLALLAAAFMLFYVCVSGWWYSYNRLSNGQRILPLESGPTISWGFFDLFLCVALFIFFSTIFLYIAMQIAGISEFSKEVRESEKGHITFLWSYAFSELAVFTMLACGIFVRGGMGAIFGTKMDKFFSDIRLGFIAFAMSIFPVLILQVILTQIWPYEHPIIDNFTDNPSFALAIPTILAAVICAPLFEEFAMRLLLQGWLGDWISGRLNGVEVLWGKWKQADDSEFPVFGDNQYERTVEPILSDSDQSVAINSVHDSLDESDNPYQSPEAMSFDSNDPRQFIDPSESSTELSPWWPIPIFISSFLFAAMHIGQGPAPIPLFFLAIVLGYLYQRTRRMTACLTVHFLLNGQSMCLLLLKILMPDI
ncbi:MAG: CPBP family intramembrane glutamic endopeptidase [Pirellulales bacterium]|jgi:membrane protease YdiL (CAAX protease family)